ncbi:MAG: NADH-quinone oxidoreductase subunit L [Nitrospirae bacterium]|nr:NADH-quinone oxidoreductase subunit L [Nitrospirota bacterium]MBI3352344.1 NADH-quinone oxidoreductase subunit L [Nitrospirota bacterium]
MNLYTLIPLFPFLAFLFIGLFEKQMNGKSHWIAVPAVIASFFFSVKLFLEIYPDKEIYITWYQWISSGTFNVSIGMQADALTAAMLLLVTTVSSLVHLYTVGYMHGDRGYDRFFAYIALFTFSMIMLVMANNFLQLYVFWEAVGLCSYLLIAHWYEKETAYKAATKAFVVNRVGDFGFGVGILLIFSLFGSLDYKTVFSRLNEQAGQTMNLLGWMGSVWNVDVLTLIAVLLFIGAMGKSAQFPLHTWLPDAMEGPTPISALIHAATMVTAGVFMVARMHPIYNLSPDAQHFIMIIGAVTAFMAAYIALTQNDIKRIVAYSTLSQLGYMMLACGAGAYTAGIFHLLTHGAFKALLFLGCGSVIHAMAGEQDLRKMGGLKPYMPVTYWTFLMGAIALSGIPPFSGFFSKDEILWQVFNAGFGGGVFWGVGTLIAFMTAFYTFRLIFSVFHGPYRGDPEVKHHLHESPWTITLPLIVLAVLSVSVGWVGIPLEGMNLIEPFLGHVLGEPAREMALDLQPFLVGIAMTMGLAGIALAYVFYVKSVALPQRISTSMKGLYTLSLNKFYIDEIYDRLFVRSSIAFAKSLWKGFDVLIVDGLVNGVAKSLQNWGKQMRYLQSGQLQHYALVMAMGVFIIVSIYLFL